MRDLEHRFSGVVAIVGVHSGKYIAERDTGNIRDASIRLDNTHPIVNDGQFRVWRAYAVRAWPTLAIIDPDGHVLAAQPGEFTADRVAPTLERIIAASETRGTLDRRDPGWATDGPRIAPGRLRFPGKVAVEGWRIAIADSGHHRLLIGELDADGRTMRVEREAGGDEGYEDGDRPRFRNPQGMCFVGDTLYIADAGNHAVRALRLGSGEVRTTAGIGRQARTRGDLQAGALASPWDVALAGDRLFVAMAGHHQLWSVELASGRVTVHSGTRAEDILDGPHTTAALAQPMGLAAADGRIYFADSESSAIRWADTNPDGAVGTIVGTGLFDFGDRDGVGDEVRLQHPQGLARHDSGRLLVADSYNHALKWIDPGTRRVQTWVRGLNEPGGLACGTTHAYVADTNAHRVVAVDYRTGEIEQLTIA